MPKDATPPPPAPRYEGYRWLGSQWGRSGKPNQSRVSGGLMVAAAVIVSGVDINGVLSDGSTGTTAFSALVGTALLLAAAFYFIEAHFAARAQREQVPTEPDASPEPPAPTEPGVGQ